ALTVVVHRRKLRLRLTSARCKQVRECLTQVRMVEGKAGRKRASRNHSLTVDQQLRHLAETGAKHERRHSEPDLPAKRASQRLLELQMRSRVRCHCIDCPTHRRFVEGELDQPHEIVNMDPRDPLTSIASDRTEARAHGPREARQRATVPAEHQTETQSYDARAE